MKPLVSVHRYRQNQKLTCRSCFGTYCQTIPVCHHGFSATFFPHRNKKDKKTKSLHAKYRTSELSLLFDNKDSSNHVADLLKPMAFRAADSCQTECRMPFNGAFLTTNLLHQWTLGTRIQHCLGSITFLDTQNFESVTVTH